MDVTIFSYGGLQLDSIGLQLVIVKLKIGLLRYWMLQYSVMDDHRIDSIRLQLVIVKLKIGLLRYWRFTIRFNWITIGYCKIENRSTEILDVTIFRNG